MGQLKKQKNDNWVNLDFDWIFKLSNDGDLKGKRKLKMNALIQAGLIDYAHKVDSDSYRVLFVDDKNQEDCKESSGDLFISRFSDIGNQWTAYKAIRKKTKPIDGMDARKTPAKMLKACSCCGKLFLGGNKSKYCNDCKDGPIKKKRVVTCKDCGKVFSVSTKNTKTVRCSDCQGEKNKEIKRIWKKNQQIKIES